jgi:hypothetical protein
MSIRIVLARPDTAGPGRHGTRAGRTSAAGEFKIMSVVCPRAPRCTRGIG